MKNAIKDFIIYMLTRMFILIIFVAIYFFIRYAKNLYINNGVKEEIKTYTFNEIINYDSEKIKTNEFNERIFNRLRYSEFQEYNNKDLGNTSREVYHFIDNNKELFSITDVGNNDIYIFKINNKEYIYKVYIYY